MYLKDSAKSVKKILKSLHIFKYKFQIYFII